MEFRTTDPHDVIRALVLGEQLEVEEESLFENSPFTHRWTGSLRSASKSGASASLCSTLGGEIYAIDDVCAHRGRPAQRGPSRK